MDDGKELCRLWQSLLRDFRPQFARGGWVRFVQWVTGMVLCDEEHTITQILTSLGMESRWRVLCQWAVSGPGHLVYAYVFEVDGYEEPWYSVCSARDLSPSQTVATVAARYRQEDGFRDHKQRSGMEECRVWTKEPVLRTFQVQMIAQTLLRLMQVCLDDHWGKQTWWSAPEWNPRKKHPSILDLRRLFWRYRE
ncbi:MAG: hypothetical protein A2V70_20650 [Planctomycetes bacterium RBG_13_63_9]|nr:MAG: hypothetical protein A2V70_20650 [Planctomycetes bacterium RBG_13_63_9]